MESRGVGDHVLVMAERIKVGRWHVADSAVQTPVIRLVEPRGGGQLYLLKGTPGAALSDDLGVAQAVHRLGQRVVQH